jgi:hypothetical protein
VDQSAALRGFDFGASPRSFRSGGCCRSMHNGAGLMRCLAYCRSMMDGRSGRTLDATGRCGQRDVPKEKGGFRAGTAPLNALRWRALQRFSSSRACHDGLSPSGNVGGETAATGGLSSIKEIRRDLAKPSFPRLRPAGLGSCFPLPGCAIRQAAPLQCPSSLVFSCRSPVRL